mgnify:CR=1 FL=1
MTKANFWKSVAVAAAVAAAAGPAISGNSGDYLAARQARLSSDYDAAVYYYVRALGADPQNPALLEGAALSQLSAGDLSRAVAVAERMEAAGVESQISQAILSAHEFQTGNFQAVLDRVAADHGVGPLVDGLMAAWAEVGKGEMANALVSFDQVAQTKGLRGFALYHKALALAMVGDFEASEAIYSDSSAGPLQMTRRGAMARIEVLSQLDRSGDALKLLDKLFGSDLDPALLQMRAVLEKGEALPFTHVTKITDGVAEIFYSVAAAHAHDFVTDDERAELSAALLFYYAIGAIFAPYVAAWLVTAFGPPAIFGMVAAGHIFLLAFSVGRMRVGRKPRERTAYVYAPRTSFVIGRLLRRN